MAQKARRNIGGKEPLFEEPMLKRVQVLVTEDQKAELKAKAKGDLSTWMRDLAFAAPPRGEEIPGIGMVGDPSLRFPIMGTTHGGPGAEAIPENTRHLTLSRDMADEFRAEPGDRFLKVQWDSMAEVGVVDGSYVLMHFLKEHDTPRRGEIALIQMENANGERKTTIKRWIASGQEWKPKLEDGAGNPFEIEEGWKAWPIMVARGVVTRL